MNSDLLTELAHRTRVMRQLQKRYFKTHDRQTLSDSLAAEREVDRLLDRLDGKPEQESLFQAAGDGGRRAMTGRCPNDAEWIIVDRDDCLVYVCSAHLESSRQPDDKRVVPVPQRNDVPTRRCGRFADVVLSQSEGA